jgi:hypothetical protein
VYRAGGREFPVYLEYDEQLDESYPAYPDFEERPEYTGEGRPFATAEQESCPHCKPNTFRGNPCPRLRRLRLVLPGGDALRPHRRLHVRRAAACAGGR